MKRLLPVFFLGAILLGTSCKRHYTCICHFDNRLSHTRDTYIEDMYRTKNGAQHQCTDVKKDQLGYRGHTNVECNITK